MSHLGGSKHKTDFILQITDVASCLRVCVCVCVCVLVAQSCLTLWETTYCSLPGSSAHGILQARILEWIASPFFRGYSQPRDWTQVSYIACRFFFTIWATKEALLIRNQKPNGSRMPCSQCWKPNNVNQEFHIQEMIFLNEGEMKTFIDK